MDSQICGLSALNLSCSKGCESWLYLDLSGGGLLAAEPWYPRMEVLPDVPEVSEIARLSTLLLGA